MKPNKHEWKHENKNKQTNINKQKPFLARDFKTQNVADIFVEIFDVACQLLVILHTDLPLEVRKNKQTWMNEINKHEWMK